MNNFSRLDRLPTPVRLSDQRWPEGTVPLVTTRTVAYMHEATIVECLEGILMQETTFPVQVLIHDDASTDRTTTILREYEERYPNLVRVFYQPENTFRSPRKHELRAEFFSWIKGKYMALCEGDDYWTDPRKLQKQADFLEEHEDCIACHHWQKIAVRGIDGKFVVRESPKDGYFPQEIASVDDIFANRMRIKTRTVMYRNIGVENNLPEWYDKVAYGDVPVSMIYGKFGKFGFINEEMAVYRITGKGVSSRIFQSSASRVESVLEWMKIWNYGNQYYGGAYEAEVIRMFASLILAALEHSKDNPDLMNPLVRFVLSEASLSPRGRQTLVEILKKIMNQLGPRGASA